MRVSIVKDAAEVAARAASAVAEVIQHRSHPVLGLATGSTPLAMYQQLVARYKHGELSFKEVTTFNLDEYVGLAGNHPQSYRYFMDRELFSQVDIHLDNTHLPSGLGDPRQSARDYDASIKASGGVDLQVLGIGRNGHIGFNEPTSSLGSRTRVKSLTQDTLDANSRFFESSEEQPSLAITMGIATILEADSIILMATGEHKAKAVADACEGPLTSMVPASALQMHPRATLIVDEAAAALLEYQQYYRLAEANMRRL